MKTTKINSKIIDILNKNTLLVDFKYNNNIFRQQFIIDNDIPINLLKQIINENRNKKNYIIVDKIDKEIFYGRLIIDNLTLNKLIKHYNYKNECIKLKSYSNSNSIKIMETIIE
jgi:hypothetical protein